MLKATQIADATDLNATTAYYFSADAWKLHSVQAMWTVTTCSATVKLQYSNDSRAKSSPGTAVWEDYATATAITATGSKMWGDIGSTIDALYWRVLYTHTSGDSDTFKVFAANANRT